MTTATKSRDRPPLTKRGKIIRDAALAKGINMIDFAAKIGMSPQGLYALLASPNPRNTSLKKLADGLREHLGVKVEPSDLV